MAKQSFMYHFRFSMNSLGLKVPTTLFSSATTAAATIKVLSGIVATYGTKVTVAEAILAVPAGAGSAAVLVQIGKVAGAVSLAYYVGACIGALAYATGEWSAERLWATKSLSNDQLIQVARAHNIPINGKMKSYFSPGPNTFLSQLKIPSKTTPGTPSYA